MRRWSCYVRLSYGSRPKDARRGASSARSAPLRSCHAARATHTRRHKPSATARERKTKRDETPAHRRPFKSWERAHRTIWELTWALTNNTAAFGRSRVASGEFPDDAAEAAAYEELLERLNL